MLKMNTLENSLLAIDQLFAKLGKDKMAAIIAEVESIPSVGPTIEEYLANFDSNFVNTCQTDFSWNDFNSNQLSLKVINSFVLLNTTSCSFNNEVASINIDKFNEEAYSEYEFQIAA